MYFRVSLQYPKRAWVSQVCQKKPKRHIKTPPFLKGKATFAFQTILETYPLAHYLRDMLYLCIYIYILYICIPVWCTTRSNVRIACWQPFPKTRMKVHKLQLVITMRFEGSYRPRLFIEKVGPRECAGGILPRSNQLRLGKLNKFATTLKVKLGLHRITKKDNLDP